MKAQCRVVLMTQGTVPSWEFSRLVEPTLAALADRGDVLVVVTTGGRPIENVKAPIPGNAQVARFLDYEAHFPKVDLLVTNGGYGTVSGALRGGVPIVAAGRTEDKAEVGARVAWPGVGVELVTDTPAVEALREAAGRVLRESSFQERTRALATEFAAVDN